GEPLVGLEAEAVERDEAVGVVVLLPQGGVVAPRRLAGSLEHGPMPGVRQEAAEQVLAAELGAQVAAPPAEPRLLATLAGPGDGELRREDAIEAAQAVRRGGGGLAWPGGRAGRRWRRSGHSAQPYLSK